MTGGVLDGEGRCGVVGVEVIRCRDERGSISGAQFPRGAGAFTNGFAPRGFDELLDLEGRQRRLDDEFVARLGV